MFTLKKERQSRSAAGICGALVLAGLILAAPQALAQDTPAAEATSPNDTSTQALLGGISFLRVHGSWAGLDAHQRAQKIQERVNQALSMGPIKPTDITVGQMQGDWVVLLKGRRFFTADTMTAHFNHTPPKALAEQWAQRMRKLLPELTAPKAFPKS